MNFSPFIYAFETENIAMTGRGTLDGQADAGPLVGLARARPQAKARRSGGPRTV